MHIYDHLTNNIPERKPIAAIFPPKSVQNVIAERGWKYLHIRVNYCPRGTSKRGRLLYARTIYSGIMV
jgi:hypothetical protein